MPQNSNRIRRKQSMKKQLLLAFAVFLMGCQIFASEAGSQSNSKSQPLILAQLTDPQIGFVDFEAELARFRHEINILNRSDCQAVVICGDMMHEPPRKNMEFFLKELSRLRRPVFLVPGNHDVALLPDSRAQWLEMFGPAYYAADLPGGVYRLVVLDTELWQHPTDETPQMDAMFLEELAAARQTGKRIILAGHSPVFFAKPDEAESYYNFPKERREWFLAHLIDSPVVAYLSGHTHISFSFLWKNILFSSGDNTSVTFDKLGHGFRRIVFDGEWVRFQTVPVEELPPSQSVNIPFLTSELQLDGKLDEAFWQEAAEIVLQQKDGTTSPENERATLRLAFTRDALVIGAVCRSPKPLVPSSDLGERDDVRIFQSADELEFFLGNDDWTAYRHLALDFAGHSWDAPPAAKRADSWNPEWQFAISRPDDSSWTAEIVIPFQELWAATDEHRVMPRKGFAWRVNFCRERYIGGVPHFQAWNPPGFHDQDAFGKIVFPDDFE